ncbi:MG2 domain-containing protein, partial [candidate division KSB1 bacterium]|nr:MG2 domain-containing protein [candidate division KSB1 bacterium]
IVASSGTDLSFLKFEDCRVSTSDFDVAGRPHLVEGYEACLYTDRGIYRPGEMAHLVAVVRDRMVAIPIEFPVKLLILGPDDRLVQESRGKIGKGGACEFEVPLATYAATGKYLARLVVGENHELGRVNFSVEEFIPDRIKVTLNTDKSGYRPGETVKIEVKAVNLFGPPASGRKVEANCEVEAITFSHPNYRSYTFEDPKKSFSKMTLNLNAAQLDTAGKYQFNLTLPTGLKPPSGLRGVLATTVTEPGGRAVSAYREIKIHPYPYYIGIRPQQEGYAQVGKPSQFDFAIIDDAGNLQNVKNLQVKIYRIVWNSILKRDSNGYFRYVSESYEEEIQAFGVAAPEGSGTVSFQPNDYGEYRLALTEPTSLASTSIQFYASGWGYAPWSMANPDRVEIAFDKQNYMPGETAKVLIKAPFAGKLLLWIEREGVLETRTLKLEKNSANIELVVKENYKPNVYVTATLIRPLKSLEKHAPVRAFGTAPLFVNCQKQQLKVELETVTDIRPRQKLQVNVKVAGASAGGLITVAAVDEGICQLTNFTTPDLHRFFYAKKRLQLEPYDIYNFLLPEFDVAKARTSVAGDLAGVRQKHLTPVDARRVKPVALWCGLTSLGADGTAKVKFDLPEFNGSLRLMAVAFDGANFGNQTQNVLVRDPIVLTPNFPRFLAPNDRFQVPVQIYNGTGKTNNFEVRLEAVGPAKIENSASQSISIKEKQEATVSFQLVAQPGLGKVKFTISAQGGGSSTSSSLEVPVRPPVPPITLTGSGMLTAAKPVTLTLPADWVSGTESYQLTTSGFPAIQFAGGLQYLLSYPHGCIEQTTSRVFPLLYFKDLARVAAPELFQTNTAEYFVEAGINQISNMQLATGGFGYWPGSTEASDWGSIYAAHFLIAARKAGYTISNQVYARMLDYVKQQARSSFIDAPDYLDLRTYALYVLASADLADKSSMIYLKNSQLAHLNASSKCFLAGAFGLSGDLKTAKELLPVTLQPQSIPRETGGIFNSGIRTNAICLMIYAELFPQNPTVPVLVKWLASQTKIGRWYTTQENAWAFMAIGKTVQQTENSQFTGEIKLNSAAFAQFTAESKVFTDRKLGGKSLEISLQGKGTGYYYWQAAGLPRTMNINESDNGLKVRRVFMNRTGQALNYQQIRHGDLIIAEIRMFAADKALENVIIADLLPAGLEIENPRIESREQVPWISDQDFTPDYMDLRDDRLILFVSLPERQEQIFYYALRAVTVGEFTLPPIKGEAMYDPVYSSIASSGVIRVVE